MKIDWSITRITLLLYLIIALIPVNYYFAKQSFDTMQNDSTTMNSLVFINGAMQSLPSVQNLEEQQSIIKDIDSHFKTIEDRFINDIDNEEYVLLFNLNEVYNSLQKSYNELKNSLGSRTSLETYTTKIFNEVNVFSKTSKEMIEYKVNNTLDKLYLSLLFTMLSVIALIFFIRIYIHLQFLKHTVYDELTGLYNKNYFNNVLKNTEELSIRQNKPLSILLVEIINYDKLNKELSKDMFEYELKKFSEAFDHFFRRSDTVCRIEEDCFAVITPDDSLENVNKLPGLLKHRLQSIHLDGTSEISVHIGVATYDKDSSKVLLEEAIADMKKSDIITIGGVL